MSKEDSIQSLVEVLTKTVPISSPELDPTIKVPARRAFLEGEGDRSLEYWRLTHWNYYQRVLEDSDKEPTSTMPIVCEQFEVKYPV